MRIVQIMAGAENGGAETYSTDMMLALMEQGVTQKIIIPERSLHAARLRTAGATVDSHVLDVPFSAIRRWRIERLIAEFKPDLIHCWMRRAANLVRPQSCPTIGWFGGYYDPAEFKSASHFVGVTNGLVAHMVAHGVPSPRAHYVPTFPVVDEAPALDRDTLATPKGVSVLLVLARLHQKKGLDTMLQALVELPTCVLWIAGDGPLETQLKALATTLGVSERVRWLGWRTDRGALLRAADVCVMPSRWEPFGNVMLEAWAAGTPLVVAAAQGPKELVRNADNGMIVPVDDAVALAAAIREVLAETGLRNTIVAGGARDYKQTFTRKAVTSRMMSVYSHIIAEGR